MGTAGNIRRLRESRDMTQQQLADVLHVKRETVTQWESGVAQPRMGTAVKLVQYFHISLNDLVGEDMEVPEKPQDALTADERMLLELYRSMDDSARQMALCALRGMAGGAR